MRRFARILFSAGLLLAATVAVQGQHPGHHDAAALRALLLTDRSVQRELKLDGPQSEKVTRLVAEIRARSQAAAQEFQGLPAVERQKKITAAMTTACNEAATTLRGILSPDQARRFDQIVVQGQGLLAFADPAVAEKLKLSPEQRDQIHDLSRSTLDAIHERSLSASPAAASEAHERAMVQSRKVVEQAVASLTPTQQATWKELTGDRFEIQFAGAPGPKAP